MKCTNCGVKLDPGSKFCSNCGTKLKREVPNLEKIPHKNYINPKVCPKCGSLRTKRESKFFGVLGILFFMAIVAWIPILGWILVIVGLLGIAGTIFGDRDYKCKDCNNTYDPQDIEPGHPLMDAIKKQSMVDIEECIEKLDNLNAVNKEGYTPLTWAIKNSNVKEFEYLIDNGANIDFKDKNGYTPINLAIKFNALDKLNTLIKNGAKINNKVISYANEQNLIDRNDMTKDEFIKTIEAKGA
jgi:ankyrin repeat protein